MISSSSIDRKPKKWSGTGGPFEWLQFASQFEASLHSKELEYLKEQNVAIIQSIKTERHILSRLNVHAKKEFDDEYYIVEKMVKDNVAASEVRRSLLTEPCWSSQVI
jgi:hypothetical protein